MSDAEWAAIRPLLPVPAWLQGRGGQPEGYCHRQMLDAIRYLVAGGISWRAMPADFPDWGRVYAFFRRWREHGLITEFHDRLRGRVREREGREAEPTAGIIDAQSVKAAASVPSVSRGWDGGKKVGGRKRRIVTDCLGLLLAVAVTAANIGDRDAAVGLLTRLRRLHRDICLVWADGGYTGGHRPRRAADLSVRQGAQGRPAGTRPDGLRLHRLAARHGHAARDGRCALPGRGQDSGVTQAPAAHDAIGRHGVASPGTTPPSTPAPSGPRRPSSDTSRKVAVRTS
ncbi:IS5 family transposase [Streptomyces sp. NPDC056663]|uniref:IS5 family transposase n=1 Tax=Streptomyces sp. NPDC056663 TaxID=3345899 RepID=UPI0036C5C279